MFSVVNMSDEDILLYVSVFDPFVIVEGNVWLGCGCGCGDQPFDVKLRIHCPAFPLRILRMVSRTFAVCRLTLLLWMVEYTWAKMSHNGYNYTYHEGKISPDSNSYTCRQQMIG